MLTPLASLALAAALQTPLTIERPTRVEVLTSGAGIGDCLVFDKTGPGPLEVVALSQEFDLRLRVSRAAECHTEGEQTWRLDQGYPQIDSRRDERFYLPDAPVGRYVVRVYRNGDAGLPGSYEVMVAQGAAVDQGVLASRIRARNAASGSSPTSVVRADATTPVSAPSSILPALPAGPRVARRQLSMGEPVTGAIGAGGATSADCYYVTTTNRYAPRFETIVRSQGFDAVVGVGEGRDCSAPVIWSNDNGGAETGGPTDARLEVTPNRPGDYFIRVDRRGNGAGNYRVMAIVDGIFTVGAGLNSPMAQRHRTTMAAARERARTEVASQTYAPPPRPANWTGLSDGDVYEVISRKIDADPASLTADERAWARYHNQLSINQYLAGVPTWRSQNPSTEELRSRAAAAPSQRTGTTVPTARPGSSEAQSPAELGQMPAVAPPEVVEAIQLWNANVAVVGRRGLTFDALLDRGVYQSVSRAGYFDACVRLGRAAEVLGGAYRFHWKSNCMTDEAVFALMQRHSQADRAAQQQAAQDRRWAEAAQSNAMRQAFLNPEVTVWSTDSSGRRTSQTMRYQEYQRRYLH